MKSKFRQEFSLKIAPPSIRRSALLAAVKKSLSSGKFIAHGFSEDSIPTNEVRISRFAKQFKSAMDRNEVHVENRVNLQSSDLFSNHRTLDS